MKLKKPNIGFKNTKLLKGRRGILVVCGLLFVVVCFFCAFLIFKQNKPDTSEKPLSCDQLVGSSQSITSREPNKPLDPTEARKRYEDVEKSTPGCEKKIEKDNSKLEALKFNYTMATESYKFGDFDKAKPYADTALSLNDQVEDGERKNGLPNKQLMREELEAVKNGTY